MTVTDEAARRKRQTSNDDNDFADGVELELGNGFNGQLLGSTSLLNLILVL